MKENNGMLPILWLKTIHDGKDPSIWEIYNYTALDNKPVYLLTSTSESYKNAAVELTEFKVGEGEKGIGMFSGILYTNYKLVMNNDDSANPVFYPAPVDETKQIGNQDMDGKYLSTSSIIYIKIKDRDKVQEMINQGMFELPEDRCKQYKIEPFKKEIKIAA